VTDPLRGYGKASEGYAIDFVVGVKDGYLHGGRGILGTPGSLRMEGPITRTGVRASACADVQAIRSTR